MKDIGQDYDNPLGESKWPCKPLGEVCEVKRGTTITKKTARSGNVPVVAGGMNPAYFHDTPNRPANVITVSGSGANAGFVNFFNVPIWASDSSTVLPTNDNLDVQFVYRYLLAIQPFIYSELARGAAQPHVYSRDLAKLPIPIPPLEEQQRIVAVLDETFEGLARARAHAEANLQNARELFENYRENFLVPSSRQGWSYRKLDELITIKHGFAFKSAFFVDKGQYAVLTPGNYHETGGFRDRGEKQRYYSGEFPSEFLLRKGDLLMAMTEQAAGLLGSCMIVPEDEGYLHNQRLGLISPKDGVTWSPEYFSQAFNLKAFRKGLSDTCSGATVRHTSPGRILAESIPYSDNLVELEAIALDLAEREQDCRNLEKAYRGKLQDLDDLRQSLLQKAFAGELT